MEVKSAQSIKDEAERKFERMHISRTLDTFKRNFSKRIPKIIDQHLSKLKVEIQLMANQMELGEMKQFSTHLEDYLFDFEDDFTEFLDEHIETVKESIRSPLSYDTDEYFSETDSDAFFQINSGYFFNNKDAVNRKKIIQSINHSIDQKAPQVTRITKPESLKKPEPPKIFSNPPTEVKPANFESLPEKPPTGFFGKPLQFNNSPSLGFFANSCN